MEIMFLLPWLLGAALLFGIFDGDDDNGSNVIGGPGDPTPPVPLHPIDAADGLTPENDTYVGTVDDDVVNGRAGSDNMRGGAGDDTLLGGNDADRVAGGTGDDITIGGNGADRLLGNAGDDILLGQNGDDEMYGQADDDILFGGFGADRGFGGDGDDLVVGDRGEDIMRGSAGNDVVSGNLLFNGIVNGKDAYSIQNDADVNSVSDIDRMGEISQRDDLRADLVYGDQGDDSLYLGDKDTGEGGAGSDIFYVSKESGTTDAAVITDFQIGLDSLVIQLETPAGTAPEDAPDPVFTVAADSDGNAQVLLGATVVALVEGQGATLTSSNVMFQYV